MSSIRLIAAGGALMLLSGLTGGGALAQTATDQAPGKPLQLLQWSHTTARSSGPKSRPRVKMAERKITHTATNGAKHRRSPVKTAEATPQATVWAPLNAVASNSTTIAATMEPAPETALASANPVPSELVVAGQTVQIASPDQVNELDLAAQDSAATASNTMPATAAASGPATNNVPAPASKSEFACDGMVATISEPSGQHLVDRENAGGARRRGGRRLRGLVPDWCNAATDRRLTPPRCDGFRGRYSAAPRNEASATTRSASALSDLNRSSASFGFMFLCTTAPTAAIIA